MVSRVSMQFGKGSMRKYPYIYSTRGANQSGDRITRKASAEIALGAVSDENLTNSMRPGVLDDGFDGIGTIEDFHMQPFRARLRQAKLQGLTVLRGKIGLADVNGE